MVGSENSRKTGRELMNCSMRKGISGMAGNEAFLLEDLQIGAKSDAAKNENGLGLDSFQFHFKIGAAILEFGGKGPIRGRRAADGSADVSVLEREAVVARYGFGLGGESGAVEGVEEEIAGAIASENAAGAVSSMCGGGKADNEKLGFRIAESWYRFAPIIPMLKGAPLGAGDGFAKANEARTLAARNNCCVENCEFLFGG